MYTVPATTTEAPGTGESAAPDRMGSVAPTGKPGSGRGHCRRARRAAPAATGGQGEQRGHYGYNVTLAHQLIRKLTVTVMITGTGTPSRSVGV